MTEAERTVRLLARRISASRQYGDEDVFVVEDAGTYFITLPLVDAEVFLYVEQMGAVVHRVLSFLMPRGKGTNIHLNNWFREDEDEGVPVSLLVSRIWTKLYADELENHDLGRVLWMHGPDLPPLPEDVPTQEPLEFGEAPVDIAAELATVLADPPPLPRPRNRKPVPLVDASVLDLFGSDL